MSYLAELLLMLIDQLAIMLKKIRTDWRKKKMPTESKKIYN